MKGLGGVLIQNGTPVAFASKAPTQAQVNLESYTAIPPLPVRESFHCHIGPQAVENDLSETHPCSTPKVAMYDGKGPRL